MVPPDRNLERAGLVADSVAVEDARAGLSVALGVEGDLGRLAGGPSEGALRVRSINGLEWSEKCEASSCDSSIATSSLLDGLSVGADGTIGMTRILPRSLSSNRGTISLLYAFLPDALVIPVTACLATDTEDPGMTTFPASFCPFLAAPSVACRQAVTAIAERHAALSSKVSGKGLPFG